jgi:hypothetical protein
LREFERGDLARLDKLRELDDGSEGEVFKVGGALGGDDAGAEGFAGAVDLHAGGDGAEVEGRLDVERDVQVAQVVVAGERLVGAAQDGLLLVFREAEAGDGERAFEQVGSDGGGLLLLELRPEDAGEQGRAEADGGEVGEEAAAGFGGVVHRFPSLVGASRLVARLPHPFR